MGYSPRHYDVLANPTYLQMVTDLRQAREAAGLSQAVVAEKIGVAWTSVSSWERNIRIPSVYHLVRWWDALNFEPAQRMEKP